MTNTKGNKKGTCFQDPFVNMGSFFLPICTSNKKGDIINIKSMRTVKKGISHKYYYGKINYTTLFSML